MMLFLVATRDRGLLALIYTCLEYYQYGSDDLVFVGTYNTVRVTYNEDNNVIMTVTGSASHMRGSMNF